MAMLNNQMVSHGLSPDFFYRFRRALAAPGAKGPKPPWAVLQRRHGRSRRRRGFGVFSVDFSNEDGPMTWEFILDRFIDLYHRIYMDLNGFGT